jgi:signal transduction histidine kinase
MKPHLLLVDDESGIRRVLTISLTDLGYQVDAAGNFDQAMALFEQNRPAVVLTDIKMPGRDGLELLEEIKHRAPETEVIMITGHGDMDLAVQSLKKQATDFITKPVSDEALEIALQRAFERIEMREKLKEYTDNLERLVAEKTKEIIENERLATVGETVAGLAHAIKNVAGGLEAGLFVMEKGRQLDEKEYRDQGWDMISSNVAKIKDLSLNLLDYAKPASLDIQDVDPNRPAREVHELMAAEAAEKGIQFHLIPADDPEPVPLDAEAVHRCLLNLVVNAFDACRIPVAGRQEAEVTVRVAQPSGAGVAYQVRDNGPGVSEDARPRVFNRFFSTKRGRGAGLGLLVTKKLVEEHGGSIALEDNPGGGALFSLNFPPRTPA